MKTKQALPETGTLPSAGSFAECILLGTRQRRLCRVFFSALGKDGFAECFFSTRQRCILPSAIFRHSAKCVFAECLFYGTRQRCILSSAIFRHSAKCVFAECLFLALGKEAFCCVHFFLALGKLFFQSNF